MARSKLLILSAPVIHGGMSYIEWIKSIFGTSLLTHWPLNETSGTTADNAEGTAARDGSYALMTLGNANAPAVCGGKAPLYPASGSAYTAIYSTSLRDAFNSAAGTVMGWFKVASSGVWTDGQTRVLVCLLASGSNYVYLGKSSSNNRLSFEYVAGGTSKAVSITCSLIGWTHFALTWNKAADEVRAYVNGEQVGLTLSSLGNWSGNLAAAQTLIGAVDKGTGQMWSGWLSNVAILNRAATNSEIIKAYLGSFYSTGLSTYLYPCFKGSSDQDLYMLHSPDGVNWTDRKVWFYPSLNEVVRDPSIVKIGSDWWMAYNSVLASSFGVAHSTDGIVWTKVATVSVASISGVNAAWAPEWFIDSDASVHILINCSTDSFTTNGQIYELHPTNAAFTAWTNPVAIKEGCADAYVFDGACVLIGSTYHLFYRSATHGTCRATASALLGPYTEQTQSIANLPGEGYSFLQVGSTWRCYFDPIPGHDYLYYSESADNLVTWGTPIACTTPYMARHGSIEEI